MNSNGRVNGLSDAQQQEIQLKLEGQIGAIAKLAMGDGDATYDRSLSHAERKRYESEAMNRSRSLRDLREAHERLKRGIYGLCLQCGGAVGYRRLLALPSTHYCINCADGEGRLPLQHV